MGYSQGLAVAYNKASVRYEGPASGCGWRKLLNIGDLRFNLLIRCWACSLKSEQLTMLRECGPPE